MELLGVAVPVALVLIGFVFLVIETFVGDGTLFIAGSALMITGFVGQTVYQNPTPLGLAATLAVSIVMMYICYQGIVRHFGIEQEPGQSKTSSSESLEGRTGYVVETVTGREGTVELHRGGFDPTYQARTEFGEIEEDEEIIVLEGGGGNVLTVAPLDEGDHVE